MFSLKLVQRLGGNVGSKYYAVHDSDVVVYPFIQRFFTQGIMLGAVKG